MHGNNVPTSWAARRCILQKVVTIYLDSHSYMGGKWVKGTHADQHGVVEEYLQDYLSNGWTVASLFNSGRADRKKTPEAGLLLFWRKSKAAQQSCNGRASRGCYIKSYTLRIDVNSHPNPGSRVLYNGASCRKRALVSSLISHSEIRPSGIPYFLLFNS